MNILVLGVGNLLLKDEGVGVRALEALQRRFEIPEEVELLDGGTSGMELLHYIQGRDVLIILDAVTCGKSPGSIVRIEGDRVPALFQKKISPHQLGLSDLIAAARLTGTLPARVVLFGIEPKELGTGLEMSDEVGAAVAKVAELVDLELSVCGVNLVQKAPCRETSEPFGSFAIGALGD